MVQFTVWEAAGTSSVGIYHADGGTYRSGFTGNRRETISAGAVRNLCADIDSLTKDTGFVPEYTFEEGIKETLCWLESQNTGDRK